MRFVSSQLASHGSYIIGFSVILFAYLDLISRFYPHRIPFSLYIYLPEALRYLMIFVIFWLIITSLHYTLMRLVFWGSLASIIIHYGKSVESSKQLWKEAIGQITKRWLKWYSTGISAMATGFWLSLLSSFIISLILFWVFLYE